LGVGVDEDGHFARPAAAGAPAAAAAPTAPPASNALRPRRHLLAGDLSFDPDPELPAVAIQAPALFDEPTEEVGAGEANAISAPEDDLVPDAPAPATAAAEPAEAPAMPSSAPRMPQLEGLNFRMIHYARQAAQLVHHHQDFGVIYAPSWPAWLAALEIRNSSRQPLVLYLTSLAADFAGPAERGWLPELERMTLRRATLVLVPDAAVQRRLRTVYGEATGEIRIVAADDEAAVQRALGEVAL
ncbi:glycosyltransferase family 4 protein, partial [Hymenobacter daeguensis]